MVLWILLRIRWSIMMLLSFVYGEKVRLFKEKLIGIRIVSGCYRSGWLDQFYKRLSACSAIRPIMYYMYITNVSPWQYDLKAKLNGYNIKLGRLFINDSNIYLWPIFRRSNGIFSADVQPPMLINVCSTFTEVLPFFQSPLGPITRFYIKLTTMGKHQTQKMF